MPKIHLVNYSSDPLYSYTRKIVIDYRRMQEEQTELAANSGMTVWPYTSDWLKSTDFYKKNEHILSQEKGAGYWLWKPYIILETLKQIPENDIVFYLDVDFLFRLEFDGTNLIYLIKKNLQNNDQLFFSINGSIDEWCKRDTFILMNCDTEEYWNANVIHAGKHFWKKNNNSIKLAEKWLNLCSDERILTDFPSILGDDSSKFLIHNWHTHDQAILGLLIKKYKINHTLFNHWDFIYDIENVEEKFKI